MSTEEAVQQELFDIAKAPEPPQEVAPEPVQETAQPEPEAPPPQAEAPPRDESIPSWRLREEADARRAAEERARWMENRLAEIERLQKQQPKKPAPNWFEDPQAAMQAALEAYMAPIQQQNHRYFQQLARESAEVRHGADNVALAEKVFMEARQRRILDPMDYERVIQAPNRFDAVVQWYQRLYSLHVVGTDPNAWWEKEFDTRMADPKFQAKLMEKLRGVAASRPAVTKLPPSLSRSTAVASNGAGSIGDLSHESLWAAATGKSQ